MKLISSRFVRLFARLGRMTALAWLRSCNRDRFALFVLSRSKRRLAEIAREAPVRPLQMLVHGGSLNRRLLGAWSELGFGSAEGS